MRYVFLALLALFPLAAFAEQGAKEAAAEWVELLDKGKYDEAWEKGALTLRLKVNRQVWNSLMAAMRTPLGAVKERKLLKELPAKDPENLPKGDYMVVLFETSFQDGKTRRELVTLVQETDGNWRPLTYHAG